MDTNEQLNKLTETCTRTDQAVADLVKRFDVLIPYVAKLDERTQSLERSRSWMHGVGAVGALLWTALAAFASFWIGHHK